MGKQAKVSVMDEPLPPPPLSTNALPSREDALRQSIAHLQFVYYGADCAKAGGTVPAEVGLHRDLADIWARIAGSL